MECLWSTPTDLHNGELQERIELLWSNPKFSIYKYHRCFIFAFCHAWNCSEVSAVDKRRRIDAETSCTAVINQFFFRHCQSKLMFYVRFGEGNWALISREYEFQDRSQLDLKDKWRNINRKKKKA